MKTDLINIRKATSKDLNIILRIQKNDGFKHAYYLTRDRFERLLNRGEVFYLAEKETGGPLGFMSIDCEVRAKLHLSSVHKKYQNKRVGTTLLNYVVSRVKSRGYKRIYVYTEIASPAENFLLTRGFEKAGYYKDRYGEGRDANILELDL